MWPNGNNGQDSAAFPPDHRNCFLGGTWDRLLRFPSMRLVATILVTVGILWAADSLLNDSRYTDVVVLALKHVALSAGFRV